MLKLTKRIAQRYARGETSTALAYEIGTTAPTLLRALRAAGVPIRRKGRVPRTTAAEVARLRAKGHTVARIADCVGLCKARIYGLLKDGK